jgi:hypothetical protein
MSPTKIFISSLIAAYVLSGCAPMSTNRCGHKCTQVNECTNECSCTNECTDECTNECKCQVDGCVPVSNTSQNDKRLNRDINDICEDIVTTVPYSNSQKLTKCQDIRINVVGQGVSPVNTTSPAQAYALAKRAAIADAYRLLAEKVKGVNVEGQDLIKNMMVTRSTVRTYVDATIRNANIVDTTFKEGLCEVEMQIVLSYSQFLL